MSGRVVRGDDVIVFGRGRVCGVCGLAQGERGGYSRPADLLRVFNGQPGAMWLCIEGTGHGSRWKEAK